MKRMSGRMSLALTLLTLVGLTVPALAAEAPKGMVAFKATITGGLPDLFVVPLDPPVAFGRVTAQGQASVLGPVSYIEAHVGRLDVNGFPAAITDAVSVMTAANGDAVFLSYSGLARPVTDGLTAEMAFTIRGGRGRFSGASGSGIVTVALNSVKKEMVCTMDGVISEPIKLQ
jgi:hypothetical protein